MYGWGTTGDGYPVAGVDYDPALLGPAAGPPSPTVQSQISDLWYAMDHRPEAPPCDPGINPNCGGPSMTQWLNANAGKVALGVGSVFALMLFAKAGR